MKFTLMQTGVVGRRHELEAGMAGQRPELYQRFLEEVKGYVKLADELGYYAYGQPEHHLQIEGFEVNNHPGMFSLFVGLHSKRLKAAPLGYSMNTHNPVRVAEEIATLDHMLQGRLICGFTRGYHPRWVESYAAIRDIKATTPQGAKNRDDADTLNRELFEENISVLKKAWTNKVFSHKGKFWEFPPNGGSPGHPAYAEFGMGQDAEGIVREIGIAPMPFQNPHPKMYGMFAASMRTVDMWAREGGKPIVISDNMEFCESLWNRYQEKAKEAGRDVPWEDTAAWGGFLMLCDSKSEGEALMAEHKWFWDKWFIPFGQKMPQAFIGTADQISDQIARAHDRLGFNDLFLMFGQGHLEPERNHHELTEFIEKVAPKFSSKDKDGTYV